MRSRLLVGAAMIALVLAACTSESDPAEPSTTTEAAPTTTEGQTTTTVSTAPMPEDERLVVGTASGDIEIYGGDLAETGSIASGVGADYRQPVWLDEGSVVFSEATSAGEFALVAADADSGEERWRASMSSLPFYYLPAPAGAAGATTSLRNAPSGGLLAELVGGDGSIDQLATVAPFYTSWSPDGGALAIHAESSTLSVLRDGTQEVIAEPTGVFQAPVWIDAGLVTLRTVSGSQRLSIWTEDGGFRDLASIDGPVRFVAGQRRIAIQSAAVDEGGVQTGLRAQALPSIPGGRLVAVDVGTGEIETVSDVLAAVYQWDPTGSRLLYATFDTGSSLDLTWHVWSPEGTIDLSSFAAQGAWFRDLVPFFDQYDQSVSIWSAAGDRIAYPAVRDGILVVVVEEADGSGSSVIEGGTWASWSRTP